MSKYQPPFHLKLGLIEMTIPNMPSNRNQKYKRK